MKRAIAKAKAAIVKVGSFINDNFELLMLGTLLAAILMGDIIWAALIVLFAFYAKLAEIANGLKVPSMNIVVNPTVVTSVGANAKTTEEHF